MRIFFFVDFNKLLIFAFFKLLFSCGRKSVLGNICFENFNIGFFYQIWFNIITKPMPFDINLKQRFETFVNKIYFCSIREKVVFNISLEKTLISKLNKFDLLIFGKLKFRTNVIFIKRPFLFLSIIIFYLIVWHIHC